MKTCRKCGTPKPLTSYTIDTRYKDGYYPWCAECRRAWRQGRKERHIALNRKWVSEHREYVREQARGYYHERYKERKSIKRREYDRERYRNNPAVRRRKNAQTAAKNRRRRAMLYGAPAEHHTEQEWQQLCEKYEHRCLRCGQQVPLTRDHVVPVTTSGSDAITNIQPLCTPCNSWKNNRTIDFRPEWGRT